MDTGEAADRAVTTAEANLFFSFSFSFSFSFCFCLSLFFSHILEISAAALISMEFPRSRVPLLDSGDVNCALKEFMVDAIEDKDTPKLFTLLKSAHSLSLSLLK